MNVVTTFSLVKAFDFFEDVLILVPHLLKKITRVLCSWLAIIISASTRRAVVEISIFRSIRGYIYLVNEKGKVLELSLFLRPY